MTTTWKAPKINDRRRLIKWLNDRLNLSGSDRCDGARVFFDFGGWAVTFSRKGVKNIENSIVIAIGEIPSEFIS